MHLGMWTLLGLTMSVGIVTALLPNMGPCSVNVESDTSFDLDQFANENNGIWSYKLVPNTPFYANKQWMFLSSNPIADSGVYQTGLFYQNVSKEPDIINQFILFDTHDGKIVASPVYNSGNETEEYSLFFLAYVPGSYAYVYICSDNGGDTSVDYRFVLSHGTLTQDQRDSIKDMESDFEFQGTLRYLTENTNN